ncbi:MAG: DUF1932 domain-containing protein [Alphaproteobacteria bacterium]|nr:DUF1932 domain-containing protein [Alphaproteobacteria bacterium]MCY4320120.1 DUF1932 domain-containing protein [Alphaproteobacteria bacterium]
MTIKTVGILSPGDMGHEVGRALRECNGLRVVTDLSGRSERTKGLAVAAGFEILDSLDSVVEASDLVLSIMPPAAAVGFAVQLAEKIGADGPVVADMNAVAPGTVRRIAAQFPTDRFVDGGIVGPSPRGPKPTRFYVSGTPVAAMEALASERIAVRPLGLEIGRASAQKMLYSALNKGYWALQAAVLTAAERAGLAEELRAELAFSQPDVLARMEDRVGLLPADADRFHPEMAEIATFFKSLGMMTGFHRGAEDLFRLLARTPLAAETRETWDRSRPLSESVRIFAEAVDRQATGAHPGDHSGMTAI